MEKRRVVVTGLGCVTPLGNSVNELWESLIQGKSGVSNISVFDAENMSVKFSASIKEFDAEKYFDIPINNWKLDKLVPSVLEAYKLCKQIDDLDS